MVKRKQHTAKISLEECHDWIVGTDTIHHVTRRYFSIVCVEKDGDERIMVDQPEIGILGFIVSDGINGREWLVQNKPEPGNINYYQFAPTVQATKSNYERVHGGKPTPYLGYFTGEANLIVDSQGSEQGDRFLNKFNRNCKCLVPSESVPLTQDGYLWVGSQQLKQYLRSDFIINTDARSVIATGKWSLLVDNGDLLFQNNILDRVIERSFFDSYHERDMHRIKHVQGKLHQQARAFRSGHALLPFSQMREHTMTREGIMDRNDAPVVSYFDVIFQEREVEQWQQPLLERTTHEDCVLLFCIEDGIAFFFLKAYPEIGFPGRVEYGPTLQTGHGQFKTLSSEVEALLRKAEIIAQIDQSDEGGRFFRNVTRYTLALWKGSPDELANQGCVKLSAGEIEHLGLVPGTLTNEIRTLLSLLLSFA